MPSLIKNVLTVVLSPVGRHTVQIRRPECILITCGGLQFWVDACHQAQSVAVSYTTPFLFLPKWKERQAGVMWLLHGQSVLSANRPPAFFCQGVGRCDTDLPVLDLHGDTLEHRIQTIPCISSNPGDGNG